MSLDIAPWWGGGERESSLVEKHCFTWITYFILTTALWNRCYLSHVRGREWGRRNREVEQFAKEHRANKGARGEFEIRTDIIESLSLEHSSHCSWEYTFKVQIGDLLKYMHSGRRFWEAEKWMGRGVGAFRCVCNILFLKRRQKIYNQFSNMLAFVKSGWRRDGCLS